MHVLSVMQEYLVYIVDETNIYFDMVGGLTLADRGAKTISLCTNGSSMRCSVLLGVSMSGEKLAPALVVFRGAPHARIQREFNNQQFDYPPHMVYCSCQTKAWVDKLVFSFWIRDIWHDDICSTTATSTWYVVSLAKVLHR